MKKVKEEFNLSNIDHLSFTSIGLACHALCLVKNAGILDLMKDGGKFRHSKLQSYRNLPLIKAALITLVGANVLMLADNTYSLTDLGENLAKNIGTIMLPFVGYRKLLAKQFELLQNPAGWADTEIDYPAIALSSIEFGSHDLDPAILEIFGDLQPKGTICDLGCGTGEKLVKICKHLNIHGLGIEKNCKVIQESKQFTKHCPLVQIIRGDIFNLKGIWADIEIAMISFVYHDINPFKRCIQFLRSIYNHFPRLRCLVVVDIVSLSESLPSIMPGFDYVHGLQGILPRSYEETIETFTKANFKIFREVVVPHMPNTFIWMIKQDRSQRV